MLMIFNFEKRIYNTVVKNKGMALLFYEKNVSDTLHF